jgi:hypothetical protein
MVDPSTAVLSADCHDVKHEGLTINRPLLLHMLFIPPLSVVFPLKALVPVQVLFDPKNANPETDKIGAVKQFGPNVLLPIV